MERIKLFHDNFQNYKVYQLPKAQLIIADIPYRIGNNAYGSNPSWYIEGDNKKGESKLAKKSFFKTDDTFNICEFMHFCTKMLKPEPNEIGKAPCIILFCSFEQQFKLIELAKKYGFNNYINLVFRKNFSAQVLKANMRIVGNCEYGLILYRNKLPKFNNNGNMIYNCIEMRRDTDIQKIHPTQKSIKTLEYLIEIFTDENDVVIDPCAGSASTLRACASLNRKAYGFEIEKKFYNDAIKKMLNSQQMKIIIND